MLAIRAALVFALVLAVPTPVFADALYDLLRAAKGGAASEVSAAIAAGADPNARGKGGFTPLHMAAAFNPEPSVAEVLIAAGHGRPYDGGRRGSWCAP